MAEVNETAPPPQERPSTPPANEQAPPAPDAASGKTEGSPLADTVAALEAKIEALTGKLEQTEADKAAAAEAAEAERKAKLSASEQMAEKVAALEAQLSETQTQALQSERARVLSRLGVRDKFARYAPDADPRTPDGLATLEKWAADNPELRKAPSSPATADGELPKSLAEKAAKGSPFLVGLKSAMSEARATPLSLGKGVR